MPPRRPKRLPATPFIVDAQPKVEPTVPSTPRRPPVYREDEPDRYRPSVRNPWVDLLISASRPRRPVDRVPDEAEGMPIASPLGGCVKLLFILFLVVTALFILVPLLVGGFLFQIL